MDGSRLSLSGVPRWVYVLCLDLFRQTAGVVLCRLLAIRAFQAIDGWHFHTKNLTLYNLFAWGDIQPIPFSIHMQ